MVEPSSQESQAISTNGEASSTGSSTTTTTITTTITTTTTTTTATTTTTTTATTTISKKSANQLPITADKSLLGSSLCLCWYFPYSLPPTYRSHAFRYVPKIPFVNDF
jgi:hypothetical protein